MEVELNEITTSGHMSLLYEAAYSGDVSMLNSLIHKHNHVLHRTSQTAFAETPLHISSLLGHHEFTKKLVTHKPNLVLEVDSSRMTALHLASAEGHIHIVKELLKVNNQPCLFPDEEGRIPLHYAAMRGRAEVAKELIKMKPESLSFRDKGKSVFNLCVTYNHLETLKALVQSEYAINGELLNFISSDDAGNTILHLAVMLKRVEVVRYLLSIPEIKEIANLKNNVGFAAQNILEQSPKDFKISEIQYMLTKAEKEGFETEYPHPPKLTSTDVVPVAPLKGGCCINMFRNIGKHFMKFFRWIQDSWMLQDKWLEEMRENLSLVSTVIATITFQALVNPPGGYIQQGLVSDENTTLSNAVFNCTTFERNQYCPGEALVSSVHSSDLKNYLTCVTISFFSSLSVTLLLVSGIFPMKNKAVIWVLSIGMCVTLTSLASAYIAAMKIIIPRRLLQGKISTILDILYGIIWNRLLGIIIVLISLRFFYWTMKRCVMIIKKSRSWGRENGCGKFVLLLRIIVIFVMFVIFSVQSLAIYVVFMVFVIVKPVWFLD